MSLKFRQATREDLPKIVRMLADELLGATGERCENIGFKGSHLETKMNLR